MKTRISYRQVNGSLRIDDYDNADDVSLRIHVLMMNRIPFTVEFI